MFGGAAVWRTSPHEAGLVAKKKNPLLAADIRAIVEPLYASRSGIEVVHVGSTNLSAGEVREALIAKGYCQDELPSRNALLSVGHPQSWHEIIA